MESTKEPDFIKCLGDSGRMTANLAVEAVGDNPVYFRRLMDISFTEPYPACMRAARVLQLFCEDKPGFILPYLDEVIEKMAGNKISGVKRNYLKIINEFVGPEKIEEPGRLVQICFDWLMSPKEDPGVRIHCAGILCKITLLEPGLKNELVAVLEEVITEESRALTNYCKKMLKKLY